MTLFTVNFQVYFLMSYKVCFGHQSEWIHELYIHSVLLLWYVTVWWKY